MKKAVDKQAAKKTASKKASPQSAKKAPTIKQSQNSAQAKEAAVKKEAARHPGDILFDEFMKPLGLSASRLSVLLHVVQTRVSELLNGRRSITCETAMRLARLFGTTAEFWLELQYDYELSQSQQKWSTIIDQEIKPIGEKELIGQAKSLSQVRSAAQARSAARSARSAGLPSTTVDAKKKTPERLLKMTDNQKKIYALLLDDELVDFDVLFAQSGLKVSELTVELTTMELDHLVERHFGDRYRRVIE